MIFDLLFSNILPINWHFCPIVFLCYLCKRKTPHWLQRIYQRFWELFVDYYYLGTLEQESEISFIFYLLLCHWIGSDKIHRNISISFTLSILLHTLLTFNFSIFFINLLFMYYIKWHFWKVNYASRLICVATYQFNWQLEILKMSTFCKTIISRHCWRLLTLSDVWLSDVDDFVLKLIFWSCWVSKQFGQEICYISFFGIVLSFSIWIFSYKLKSHCEHFFRF